MPHITFPMSFSLYCKSPASSSHVSFSLSPLLCCPPFTMYITPFWGTSNNVIDCAMCLDRPCNILLMVFIFFTQMILCYISQLDWNHISFLSPFSQLDRHSCCVCLDGLKISLCPQNRKDFHGPPCLLGFMEGVTELWASQHSLNLFWVCLGEETAFLHTMKLFF